MVSIKSTESAPKGSSLGFNSIIENYKSSTKEFKRKREVAVRKSIQNECCPSPATTTN